MPRQSPNSHLGSQPPLPLSLPQVLLLCVMLYAIEYPFAHFRSTVPVVSPPRPLPSPSQFTGQGVEWGKNKALNRASTLQWQSKHQCLMRPKSQTASQAAMKKVNLLRVASSTWPCTYHPVTNCRTQPHCIHQLQTLEFSFPSSGPRNSATH